MSVKKYILSDFSLLCAVILAIPITALFYCPSSQRPVFIAMIIAMFIILLLDYNAEKKRNGRHSDDVAVDRFCLVMKDKLKRSREKGRSGWETASPEYLSRLLIEHVEKGDPLDVANFCMMLHQRSSPILFETVERTVEASHPSC